jgi:hypothetical protein
VRLVVDGVPACSIVVGADCPEPVRFAAEELARYVAQISGAALLITDTVQTGLVPVHLGINLAQAGPLPEPKAGYDGYRLVVAPDRIVVSGDNPRAVLYGVYDLLERLGCRWYYPTIDPQDPEIVPTAATVELDELAVSEASPFKHRVCHPSSMIYNLRVEDALAQVDWAAKARYNVMLFLLTGPAMHAGSDAAVDGAPAQALEAGEVAPPPALQSEREFWDATAEYETSGVAAALRRRGMLLEGPNHCMLYLLPNSLFDEHPDWFGTAGLDEPRVPQGALGPEFCWSNEEAAAAFTDNCVRWLAANPHIDVFSCAPNDGGKACKCARCDAVSSSDRYAVLMNLLMAKIRAAGLPVELEILGGYDPVLDPPSPGLLDPQIRVHWAHWGRPHDQAYGDPDYPLRDNLEKWLATGSPLTMVNYYTDAFATPPIFPPVSAAYQVDNAWMAQRQLDGVMSLMFPHESWWAHSLNGWLAISWFYPDRPVAEFLDDYSTHYFGAAAGPMGAVNRLLAENLWLTSFCCGPRWSEPVWASSSEAERAVPLLHQIAALLTEAAAVAVDEVTRYRRDRVLATWRVLVLMGETRSRNTDLVHEYASGPVTDELVSRLRAALQHEVEVVDPAADGLRSLVGVLPRGWEGDKIVGGAAKELAAVLDKLDAG